jgi:hypothetical protein
MFCALYMRTVTCSAAAIAELPGRQAWREGFSSICAEIRSLAQAEAA